MKIDKLQNKSRLELKKLIANKREKLRVLRFHLAGGKLKNVREVRQTKKDIARILTILREA